MQLAERPTKQRNGDDMRTDRTGKQSISLIRSITVGLLALTMLSPLTAKADCASPVGVEADMYYNTTYKRVQFCDGTNWINMGVSFAGTVDNLGNHTATANIQLGAYWLSGDGGSEGISVDTSGRVGIGMAAPAVPLNVAGGTDTALASGGFIVTGLTSGANISIDNNEIMARNNGATSPLYLNADGGIVYVGSDGLSVGGTITGNGSGLTTLNASNLASGTVPAARLGTGTANATTYLRGDGTWATTPTGADNLGNHTATQALAMGGFAITGAGVITGTSFTGVGTALTALNATNLGSGTVSAARMPALTGDVTMTAGTTVTNIAPNAITSSELADDAVTIAKLAATGTPSATTFLRGDNTWATPAAGGGVTGRTSVTCTATASVGSNANCIATCTAGYFVSGCSVWQGTNFVTHTPNSTSSRLSGNGCECMAQGTTRVNCIAHCIQ